MATTINTNGVTIEQLDRVERVYDYNARQHFCIVKSESDDLVEYHVRYDKAHQCFTCSCPSGQSGFANVRNANGVCKHVVWSVAYAKALRQEQAEQAYLESLVRQGLTRDEATRVAYAKPQTATAYELKQAEVMNAAREFRLMR